VIIGVTASLVTLLVAPLGRSHELAKLTICKTRLHDVSEGLVMYAMANDSYLPVGEHLSDCVDDTSFNPQPELLAALFPTYVDNAEVFYCPSEIKPELAFTQGNVDAGRIGYFYYSCRKAPANRYLAQFLWRPSGVHWPRQLRLGADPATWVMSDSWLSGEPTPHHNYKKGVNYLRMDGTVDMVETQPRADFR